MTPIQKIVLSALNVLVAPLLELTTRTWGFETERKALKHSLQRLGARTTSAASERELRDWRERIVNQRKSLRQLRMQLLERTQVWTGATYTPVERLENADLLGVLTLHTNEALELLDVFERITPNLFERTVYSKLNVTRRCALCMQFSPFSTIRDLG